MNPTGLFPESLCPIARSLDLLGQKWSLMIVREAVGGATRFADFRAIGIPSDILTKRLISLVDAGVLEKHPYQAPGERARDEYVLSPAGRALLPVLSAFVEWGTEYLPIPAGRTLESVTADTGERVQLAYITEDGTVVDQDRVTITTIQAE
ncbi:transcriptional regulator [Mycetocola tolaasinivorans]|uniref:Transcriptional regulator n=1 Tax=Mycetocola tolaasinivorans TaxID=76635 RepID=A0A3L7ABY8_9MICO|nr:helix-turn-helix domain-containing protein [Mycetocola tolaasinivorans]RLP78006.1 transcriptional regulator [Mycetocola tolaasinivorans]